LTTGSRSWADEETVSKVLTLVQAFYCQPGERATVVHGACNRGADALVDKVARSFGCPVETHPADWERHGRSAGFRRNQEMVDLGANVCLAFWDGESRGTLDCFSKAVKAGIPVRLIPERKGK